MSELPDSFRDQLLGAEKPSASLREKYDEEVRNMLEKKLNLPMKAMYAAVTVLSITIAIFLACLAVAAPHHVPLVARFGLAGGALFSLVWAGLGWRTLRRGTFNIKADTSAQAILTWLFVVFLATIFFMAAPQRPELFGLQMAIFAVAWLVIGGVFLVNGRVNQADLNTREKLLELELHLAELQEELRKK